MLPRPTYFKQKRDYLKTAFLLFHSNSSSSFQFIHSSQIYLFPLLYANIHLQCIHEFRSSTHAYHKFNSILVSSKVIPKYLCSAIPHNIYGMIWIRFKSREGLKIAGFSSFAQQTCLAWDEKTVLENSELKSMLLFVLNLRLNQAR